MMEILEKNRLEIPMIAHKHGVEDIKVFGRLPVEKPGKTVTWIF